MGARSLVKFESCLLIQTLSASDISLFSTQHVHVESLTSIGLGEQSGLRIRDQRLLVEDIYEPLCRDNCLKGDSPLLDYLLSADKRPFRLVELPGQKLGTVDVEDLQKLPVRVLLFMKFSLGNCARAWVVC